MPFPEAIYNKEFYKSHIFKKDLDVLTRSLSVILNEEVKVEITECTATFTTNLLFKLYLTNNNYLAEFKLIEMPGCCGVCISFNSWVNNKYRRKGVGTLLAEFRKKAANILGYTVMLCTDVDNNIPQQRILDRLDWKQIYSFKNKRTGNNVNIHAVTL